MNAKYTTHEDNVRTYLGRSRMSLVAVISFTFVFCGRLDLARGQQAEVTNKTLLPPMSNYVPMTAEGRWNDYVRQNFAQPGVFFQTFFTALGDQTGRKCPLNGAKARTTFHNVSVQNLLGSRLAAQSNP